MNRLALFRSLVLLTLATLASPLMAYQTTSSQAQYPTQTAQTDSRRSQTQFASGQKMKVKGSILRRENDGFVMRSQNGSDMIVRLAGNTKIEEKKGNPFRGAKKFSPSNLLRGLTVEVEGRGDSSGALLADKVKFSDDALEVATSIDTQIVPVENRLGTAENRLSNAEQNAQRLSGQVEELGQVANLAKGGARAAQEAADAAIDGVTKTNDRISTLDDYEVKKDVAVAFKVGSSVLSTEAKGMLDEIATQAKNEHGFVIEVRGFASSDGSENLNRLLSQRRADGVIRYLAETHDIPLRRIILPFGYGEAAPVADNTTREGRKQNRRVEVKILVSRGLTTPVNVNRPISSNRQ